MDQSAQNPAVLGFLSELENSPARAQTLHLREAWKTESTHFMRTELRLDDETIARHLSLTDKEQNEARAFMINFLAHPSTPSGQPVDVRARITDSVKAIRDRYEKQDREILGEENFAKFQAFKRNFQGSQRAH